MSIHIGDVPPQMLEQLFKRLHGISFPTLGHYLESGFCASAISRQCGQGRIVGTAFTVRLTAQDSTLLHHAVSLMRERDVLVIDTGGDQSHAPVGLVIASAANIRKASGIIVDGVVTDIDEIEPIGIPIYAKGRSILTTKLLGTSEGGLNVPISVGGVAVNSGDIVLADSNGVAIIPLGILEGLLDTVEEDDASEPELISKLKAGARLGDETGASDMIENLLKGH